MTPVVSEMIPVPPSMAQRAMTTVATPAAVRDAASVVLLRDGESGLQTYLLRRQQSMKFAAGMYVFPGGVVDPDDQDIPWVGEPAPIWAGRFHCDEPTARGLVSAAVRETFEESGILLAGPDADSIVADTGTPDWLADRDALEKGEFSFAAFLERRQLVLRADLLGAWSHWITPAFEPHRYDTRFFIATVPPGQQVGELSGESADGTWMNLTQALAGAAAGSMLLLPPTLANIREAATFATADQVLAASRDKLIDTIEPKLVVVDGSPYLQIAPTPR